MTADAASASSPAVMDRLKAETRDAHAAAESIPFNQALVDGRLPLERYVAQLAAYRLMHDALEHALAESDHPAIRAVWREDLRKVALLDRDLEVLSGAEDPGTTTAASAVASDVAGRIQALAIADPVALLGALYVLEGSTLGGTILRRHLATAFDLEEDRGLSYYSSYGNNVMPHWREFRERMNGAVTDPAEQERVLEAARTAFDDVGRILSSLSASL